MLHNEFISAHLLEFVNINYTSRWHSIRIRLLDCLASARSNSSRCTRLLTDCIIASLSQKKTNAQFNYVLKKGGGRRGKRFAAME